ncbi:uncharacterized protein TNCV_4763641 [Trichonephila clavipes]|nr:uncharacterized protein TNCV_4763641 [Trichonephila clavipes]
MNHCAHASDNRSAAVTATLAGDKESHLAGALSATLMTHKHQAAEQYLMHRYSKYLQRTVGRIFDVDSPRQPSSPCCCSVKHARADFNAHMKTYRAVEAAPAASVAEIEASDAKEINAFDRENVEEDKASNVQASTSVRLVAEALDLPRSTVPKIMRNILLYYLYKLQLVQELLPHDFETRHLFSLQFLARLEVDPEWPWDILWTDESHFHLEGSVNTHNCRIWESDNPHSTLQVPLHSPKVTVWCGFSVSFILGPYFFEELGAESPVTCSITGQRYASLLRNKIFPHLQARQCLSRIIFMQDGAPAHITCCVKDVLKHHFTEKHVISRQFLHLRSPDHLTSIHVIIGFGGI